MKKIEKIIAFGDSWTAGEGFVPGPDEKDYWEEKYKGKIDPWAQPLDLMTARNKHSWPRWLADEYNADWINHGVCGSSNRHIMDRVFTSLEEIRFNSLQSETLLICMWSSPLRENLSFFPDNWNDNFISWSEDLFSTDRPYKNKKAFERYFKKLYLTELYDESYLNHKNLIYIKLVEELCKFHNINYMMCNGFEVPVKGNLNIDNYFFSNGTLHELLIKEKSPGRYFTEENDMPFGGIKYKNSRHPNIKGYKKISQYLKEYIDASILEN